MKKYFILIILITVSACSSTKISNNNSKTSVVYSVNVTDPSDDLFHITISVSNLSSSNNIYNMPATVPGTYQIMDFGRFANDFKVFDTQGNEISTEKISVNRWKIESPELVSKIEYNVEDTFDSGITEKVILPMGGTGIGEDYVIFNTYCVLGYFEGLQSSPTKLKVDYPAYWELGTALEMDAEGYFFSETYDHLADSPILMGNLTVAETMVGNVPVEVYVYSTDTAVTAHKVLTIANDVLQSSEEFIGFDAAPHYKFLMYLPSPQDFAEMKLYGGGALEHSLSSLYVMPGSTHGLPQLRSVMAHEFLHILTPLNLHSEIIHTFNFIEPEPSQHIWLYEGVTEWASDIMQLRGGITDFDDYFRDVSQKMTISSGFIPQQSLVNMALYSYEEDGYGHFFNFYNKGALTAACLDIELLKLSEGKAGLRELYIGLLKEYGKDKPFSEKDFFNVIVDKTYPEIEVFINNYIKDTLALPVKEYFADMGFKYIPERNSEDNRPSIGGQLSLNADQEIIMVQPTAEAVKAGWKEQDVIKEFLGIEVNLETIQKVMMTAFSKNIGDPYKAKVRRGEKTIEISGNFLQTKDYHIFEEMESITPEQKMLREVWAKNL